MNAKNLTWEEAVEWLRNQPDKQELVFNCYYDDPLELSAERFNQSEEWQAVRQLLGNHLPGKVLDLGAGRGISSYAFSRAGCAVTALEPDPSYLIGIGAIEYLYNSTGMEIQVAQNYGEALSFSENSFDIVYGRAVLHHAQDLGMLCQEAYRVLRPGGILLVTREHVISKKEDLDVFLEAHPLHSLYGGENAFLLEEYSAAITKAGFKLSKVIGPFESVINYAPLSHIDFQARISQKLASRLGSRLAEKLAASKMLQQFVGRYISSRAQDPGRHYSFLAVKV